MLTPQDIRDKEFTKAVRGYSVEEVDAFLDQLCADYERNLEEIERLKERVENVRVEEQEAFDNLPESIQQSDKGQAMEEATYNLDEAAEYLENAEDSLQAILDG